jgi:hypothetical protein
MTQLKNEILGVIHEVLKKYSISIEVLIEDIDIKNTGALYITNPTFKKTKFSEGSAFHDNIHLRTVITDSSQKVD